VLSPFLLQLFAYDVAVNFTAIGSGLISWKTFLPAAQDAGVQHFFVENDEPKGAIANITASCEYLNKLRF
jgi:sugar phosphate isomerase/epimerase